MRIEYLIYFLNVAQSRSISISARELYISQQSLSWAIKTLEQEIGAPLLERHYYGVELTQVGEIVAEHAGRIVQEHYAMCKNVLPYLESVTTAFSGQLRVGINYHIVNELLHTIIHTFSRQNPGVQLCVRDYSAEQMAQAVAEGELELALFGDWAETPCPAADELLCESLYEAELLVCTAKRTALAGKRHLTPAELVDEPLVQYADTAVPARFFAGCGTPRVVLETSSTDLYRQAIQDGLGYGLTNRLDWQEDYSFEAKKQLAIIPVEHPHAAICYRLLYRRAQLSDPCLSALLHIIRQRFDLLDEAH